MSRKLGLNGPQTIRGHVAQAVGAPALLARRDDVQGMRALAVLSVMVYHLNADWLPGGFVGVDMFFVISGYLITALILSERDVGSFSLMDFYWARIRRILPAYLVVIGLASLCMAVLLVPHDFRKYLGSLQAAIAFASNIHFSGEHDYFAPASHELPLLHTWSLAVEMQFYLLFPAVLIAVPRRFLATLIGTAFVVLLGLSEYRLHLDDGSGTYFLLWPRVPEFLAGSILAVMAGRVECFRQSTRTILAILGLLLISGSFFLLSGEARFPGLKAIPVIAGTACLLAARGSAVNAALAMQPFARMGDLSYSLYLWHWTVLVAIRYLRESYEIPPGWAIGAAIVIFALSILSYRFVELPFRRSPMRWGPVVRLVALACAVGLAVLAGGFLNPRLSPTLPVNSTRYAQPDEICHGKVVGDCTWGDKGASVSLLLIGDSHAAQLNLFAETVASDLGVQIEVVSASSCIPIEGFDLARIPERAWEACRAQTAVVYRRLPIADGVVLAGKWSYHFPSVEFRNSLIGLADDLAQRGKPLLVLAQVPKLDGDVQRSLRLTALGLPQLIVPSNDWQQANRDVSTLLAKYPNVTFRDLSTSPLFATVPFFDGRPIYFDSHHLNEQGARLYGKAALSVIQGWLEGVVHRTGLE